MLRRARVVVLWVAYALVAVLVGSASASIVRTSVLDDPSPVLNADAVDRAIAAADSASGEASSPTSPAPTTSPSPSPTVGVGAPAPSASVRAEPTSATSAGTQAGRTPTVAAVDPTPTPTSRSSDHPASTASPSATPTPRPTDASPHGRTPKPTALPRLRYRYFPTAGGIVLASCRGPVLRVRATPAFNWGIGQIERSRSRAVVNFNRTDGLRKIAIIVRCVNQRPVARIQFSRVAPSNSLAVNPFRQTR